MREARTEARGLAGALLLLGLAACQPRVVHEQVAIPGGTLATTVVGQGRDTVVVLHGGPGLHSGYLLGPLAPLARDRALIFYDARGRGQSSAMDLAQVTVDAEVEDLERIRQHYHLGSMKVIAHHWGGMVALLYAERHPGQVQRIVMVGPYVAHPSTSYGFRKTDEDSIWRLRAQPAMDSGGPARDAKNYCERFWPLYFVSTVVDTAVDVPSVARTLCDLPADRLRAIFPVSFAIGESLGAWDWRGRFADLKVPVLVVEADGPSMAYYNARRWLDYLPDSRLLILNRPYGMPWQHDASRFQGAVNTFLGGTWPAAATEPDSIRSALELPPSVASQE